MGLVKNVPKNLALLAVIVIFLVVDSIIGEELPGVETISEKKCKEYQEIYREMLISFLPFPFNETEIGELVCPEFREPLVFGGISAEPGEFPFMASLLYENEDGGLEHRCGGTIISENYVLTAAHCITPRFKSLGPSKLFEPKSILVGDISLEAGPKNRKDASFRKMITIEEIIIHPEYGLYNDIALIKLAENLTFSQGSNNKPEIRPACLPPRNLTLTNRTQVLATGWGATEKEKRSTILQVAKFPITDLAECNTIYSEELSFKARFPSGLTTNEICAGKSGKDTCEGDSGGPISIPLGNLKCMQYVIGITSVGPSSCGSSIPAIYTNVEKYLGWIENIVWGGEENN